MALTPKFQSGDKVVLSHHENLRDDLRGTEGTVESFLGSTTEALTAVAERHGLLDNPLFKAIVQLEIQGIVDQIGDGPAYTLKEHGETVFFEPMMQASGETAAA